MLSNLNYGNAQGGGRYSHTPRVSTILDRLSLGTSNFFVETTKVGSRHRHQCYGMLKLQGIQSIPETS